MSRREEVGQRTCVLQQHMYAGCSPVLHSVQAVQAVLAFALLAAVVGSCSICPERVVQEK
jgi:hypothetical protein